MLESISATGMLLILKAACMRTAFTGSFKSGVSKLIISSTPEGR